MSITAYFEQLEAPLTNPRWSWGAVRASDGAVVLRVWQDHRIVQDRTPIMMLTHHSKYQGREDNLGYQERLEHVWLVREGATCYMVMCLAVDPEASPRKIQSYNSTDVFVGGELLELDGDTWITLVDRLPWQEVAK
ncbi:MAG: hypothetical protein GKR94_20050 [Gammaproteobacteria bacterium]|nr:hypothetical protein [Gammaproteobacteria bacterium]